jgi:peptide/nickel transport system ATP-binding protein
MTDPVLAVRDLRIEVAPGRPIVDGVNLDLARGQVLGLVGESGCGKTSTALALLGFFRSGVRLAGGKVVVAGQEVTALPENERRLVRGRVISYVPQEPGVALNPSLRIGEQLRRMVSLHLPSSDTGKVIREAMERVDLPTERGFLRRFPHQLSGGQQQRVTIAIALACHPAVAVLDEPTTGLDVVVQAWLLAGIRRLQSESGLAMVYVSHDLAVVASIADRIAVIYAGRVVEEGPTRSIIDSPRHPYTRGLIAAIPDSRAPRTITGIPGVAASASAWRAGCAFAARCEQRTERCATEPHMDKAGPAHLVRCFHWTRTPPVGSAAAAAGKADIHGAPLLEVTNLHAGYAGRGERVVASSDVSFVVSAGECLALVGESGSGKTTIARCVAGLHAPDSGTIRLAGMDLAPLAADRTREARRRIQIVFQNPYDSLNPRHTIRDAVSRPARFLRGLTGAKLRAEVELLLAQVRLPRAVADRYPAELSGGERQRVAIARALAAGPELLVCDEITSALDVSVQAAVMELIADLRRALGIGVLLISHDLGVVASVADRLVVLRRGHVREQGPVRRLLESAKDEYTRQLVLAAPTLVPPGPAPGLPAGSALPADGMQGQEGAGQLGAAVMTARQDSADGQEEVGE